MMFESPWWLLLVAAVVPFVIVVGVTGRRTAPRGQHRWSVIARVCVVILLVVALAGPLVQFGTATRAVLFLVDRSASISPGARAAQDAFIAEAMASAEPDQLTGVAVFGASLVVDAPLGQARSFAPIRTDVDGSVTDIATALLSAEALLPSAGSRRIVLLTDVTETRGRARVVAQKLAEADIAVDIVALETGTGPDAVMEEVDLPGTVRVGDHIEVTITVRSNFAGDAVLAVRVGDGAVDEIGVALTPGRNEIRYSYVVAETGTSRIRAEITSGVDTQQANNRGEGLSRVLGPARVVIVEGKAGEAEELTAAVEASGYEVDVVAGIPSAALLLEYDAVVLVNVSVPDVEAVDRLAAFVESLGRGLVVVGGDQAYGQGGYSQSALEELLPVRSDPDDLVRRQPVAQVFAIDTSGSMADCHCRNGVSLEGGVNKTDISRAGAELAIDALSPTDRIGVLAFGSSTDWVIPFGLKPSRAEAENALATLVPEGGTAIARGLEAALEELKGADEQLRHIVLFTDGWDPNEGELLPVAREIAESGVTLSVLGTGEGPGITLRRMAEIAGGRYYSGTDLDEVPEIFVEETLTVARSLAQEGSFLPLLNGASRLTRDLTAAPPLRGYVLTKAKVAAQVPLLVGREDPLLATWQRGLGRVTAWTSDATARWSADWVEWEPYAQFWGRIVGDVLPPGRETPPEVRVAAGFLEIRYEADGGSLAAVGTAIVRDPDGTTRTIQLQRTSDTVYEGRVRTSGEGAYWVSTSVVETDGDVIASASAGAIMAYPAEFAFREPDPTLAADLAGITGGRVDPTPDEVHDAAPASGTASRALWPWLTGLALALFLIDVTLRRLVLRTDQVGIEPGGPVSSPSGEPSQLGVPPAEAVDTEAPATETLSKLLDRKRR